MEQSRIQTLVNKSLKGDTKAFEELVINHQTLVYRLAFRLLCNEEDARDVVQETFIKVWLSLGSFDFQCRFSTWIYKIATNAAHDKLRVLQRTSYNHTTPIDFSDLHILSGEETDQNLIKTELKEVVTCLTAELTPTQRLVFTLRDLEELNTAEIEVITGLSAAKIKSNLYLARKFLRERIKKLNIQL